MKKKAKVTIYIFFILILSVTTIACGKQPGPDWNSRFVVFQGNTYEITEQEVTQIDKKIGKIGKLINDTAIHSGTFSNKYPKGTLLYQITNVDIKESIAVEVSKGKYLQADFKRKYGK